MHNSDRIGWENEPRKSRGKDLEIPTEGDEEERDATQYTITIFLNRLPISTNVIYWKPPDDGICLLFIYYKIVVWQSIIDIFGE